jgi:hypothetical protein
MHSMGGEILNIVFFKKLQEKLTFRFSEIIRLMENNLPFDLCSCILLFLLKSGSTKYCLWWSTQKQVLDSVIYHFFHICELELVTYHRLKAIFFLMQWWFFRLDLYFPKNLDGPKPVVAFVTGGAWIIGWAI